MAETAIYPGKHFAEELKKLNVSAAALARWLKVPANRSTEILNASSRAPRRGQSLSFPCSADKLRVPCPELAALHRLHRGRFKVEGL